MILLGYQARRWPKLQHIRTNACHRSYANSPLLYELMVTAAPSSASPRPSPRIAISNYYPLSQMTDAFNHGLLRPFQEAL